MGYVDKNNRMWNYIQQIKHVTSVYGGAILAAAARQKA